MGILQHLGKFGGLHKQDVEAMRAQKLDPTNPIHRESFRKQTEAALPIVNRAEKSTRAGTFHALDPKSATYSPPPAESESRVS
jgi:hypothetical protein